jgi:FxsC-like protein
MMEIKLAETCSMSYRFFFSYARVDREPYLEKFYKALVDNVRMKVGGDRKQIGFMDTEAIQLGQEWRPALAEALQTAKAFVPVYTASYFANEFCGKEWRITEDRRAAYAVATDLARPPVILPVLWVPPGTPGSTLPQVATDLQYSHESLGKLYVKEGMWQLMKRSKYRDAREEVINRLGDKILEVAQKYDLPSLPVAAFGQVQSAFHGSPCAAAGAPPNPAYVGPRYVQFIFVAGRRHDFELQKLRNKLDFYGTVGGLDWQPYLPEVAEEIALIAQGVATSEKLLSEVVPLDANLIQRLDAAERDNKIVAILVDTWTLRLEKYREFMREYDKRSYPNCVVLIPWNFNDEETKLTQEVLQSAVQLTFVNRLLSKDPNSFFDTIGSPQDLRTNLSTALNTARMRILNIAEVKKKAESQQVFRKPVLQN